MGYPQCIGAIDGCHIEIHPKKEEAIDYHNYKGWYSVVLLALVDAKYRFSYIHCGSPGRCNDSSIFEKSSLKRELQECALLDELSWQYGSTKIPVHVIGDSAFRLSQHLMKPYPHSVNNTPEQKKLNYILSKCRRVVENAFGHLKARFRRIGKGVDNHVLHNFLIAQKDSIVENWVVEMQRDSRCNPQCSNNQSDRSEGELIRNSLKEYFHGFSLEMPLATSLDDKLKDPKLREEVAAKSQSGWEAPSSELKLELKNSANRHATSTGHRANLS
ncbi:uncharacterized protein LOC118736184 [Rhagoletis pomonella]|uniref:uncharacterized protein LOC118736184 n=1 Tax=Rhagoletis pomonella TaxID=28610 RepID=UPI00177E4EB2|nr:uncharacterized protein LOC118736184 [Rhagoletis pomonella]